MYARQWLLISANLQSLFLASRSCHVHVQGYHSGVKAAEIKGESLYNSNELEPHVVMQLLEKAMRLTLTDRKQTADAERAQKAPRGEYEADKPEAEDEHPSNEEPPGFQSCRNS